MLQGRHRSTARPWFALGVFAVTVVAGMVELAALWRARWLTPRGRLNT